MEKLELLLTLSTFIIHQFPVIALLLLSAVTLILAFRERHQYNMTLKISREEAEIRRLAANGTLNDTETERLLANCNALPETEQKYPEPDFALKLVSAFARIHALLKLLFFASVLVWIFGLHFLAGKAPELTSSLNAPDSSFGWTVIMFIWGLTVVFSIWEFRAAKQVCRGGIAARNFLIFVWLFDLLLPLRIEAHALLFQALMAGCGIYTLYVLAFRKDAARRISFQHPEFTGRKKIVMLSLLATVIACGWAGVKFTQSFSVAAHGSAAEVSSSSAGPVCAALEEILLIQGTPEEETLFMADCLAEKIRKELDIPCHVQKFDAQTSIQDLNRQLPLVILRTDPCPNPVLKLDMPGIGQSIPLNISSPAGFIFKYWRKHLSFDLHTLRRESYSSVVNGLLFSSVNRSFTGKVLCGYSGSAMRPAVKKAAENLGKKLIESLKSADTPAMRIPSYAADPEPFPLPELSGLAELRLVNRCYAFEYQMFDVYRFRISTPEQDLAYIRKQLSGSREENKAMDGVSFSKIRECRGYQKDMIDVLLSAGDNASGINADSRYGLLVCRRASMSHNKQIYSARTLEEFRRNDPVSFALANGIRLLKTPEEQLHLLEELSDRPEFGLDHKLCLLDRLADHEFQSPVLQNVLDRWFRMCADQTIARKESSHFLRRVNTLVTYSGKEGKTDLRKELVERLGDMYLRIVIPEQPGRIVRTFPKEKMKSPTVIEFVFDSPDYRPLWYGFGFSRNASGMEIFGCGNRTATLTAAGGKAHYFFHETWNAWKHGGQKPFSLREGWSQSGSSEHPFEIPRSMSSDGIPFEIRILLDTHARTLTLGVLHDMRKAPRGSGK